MSESSEEAIVAIETGDAEPAEVVTAREKLAPFLAANPSATVGLSSANGEKIPAVLTPWGDASIVLTIPSEIDSFAECLNSLLLPDRLSAIWHRDTKELEVIWTAYRMPPSQKEIVGRKFKFTFADVEHECEFGNSSDRLRVIAKQTIPIGISGTAFRNLHSFARYMDETEETKFDLEEPRSFWIRNVEWNEDDVLSLLRNLNFYITYYDNRSPTVLIHNVRDNLGLKPRPRYVVERYPNTINTRTLDDTLLNFWDAAQVGDPARRFLYYYRIIEYASFFYLDLSARAAVKKILAAPNVLDDVSSMTEKVISAIGESKLDEYQRFGAVIRDNVNISVLWRELFANFDFYAKPTNFDGGFVLQGIVGPNCQQEDFEPRGHEVFTKAIRDIRNALSHGRDQKTGMVITPTVKNLNLLQPWVNLIAAAAGEVVLYKDAS